MTHRKTKPSASSAASAKNLTFVCSMPLKISRIAALESMHVPAITHSGDSGQYKPMIERIFRQVSHTLKGGSVK
jgi:hypothetical protein